jgi:hypothetical protein
VRKILKYVALALSTAVIVSILFYGVQLPAKDYFGCYINRKKTKKICIHSDRSFEQFVYKNEKWVMYGNSVWSSVMIKDVAGQFSVLTVESVQRSDGRVLINVALQPYKDIIGRIKISTGFDAEEFDEGEVFIRL